MTRPRSLVPGAHSASVPHAVVAAELVSLLFGGGGDAVGHGGDSTSYFVVRTVPFAGASWTYADARNVLLVVFGLTERTRRLVLIRQYRPPIAGAVLSAPMGCYPDDALDALLPVAATEAEAETGHRVVRIAHLLDFARSPGLTTERARCFIARYAEAAGPQQLHSDEQIEVRYVPRDEIDSVVERAATVGEVIDSSVLLCSSWLLSRMEALLDEGSEAEPAAAPDPAA